MSKRRLPVPRIALFPKAVVVVTAVNNAGELAATPIAWNGIMSSRPPVIGVSFLPDSFARSCIVETREFVINVPAGNLWREVNHLGSLSGRWEKKAAGGGGGGGMIHLTTQPSSLVRAPRIAECYLNIECRVLNTLQIGLYDCFLGEVLTMHCDEDVFQDTHPKGAINHAKVRPLLCLADEYWAGDSLLGLSTENKDHPHGREH